MSNLSEPEVHALIQAPIDRTIELALIDAYTTADPSEWEHALSMLRPWYHIAAILIAILQKEENEFMQYIKIFTNYRPEDPAYIPSAAAIVMDTAGSLDLDTDSIDRCNTVLNTCLYNASKAGENIGQWSI